jgi:hypothetical protein
VALTKLVRALLKFTDGSAAVDCQEIKKKFFVKNQPVEDVHFE